MATKHTSVDSKGQIHTRTSRDRVYPFCVITHWKAYESAASGRVFPAHSTANYCGRRDLAQKSAAQIRDHASCEGVEILECKHEAVGKMREAPAPRGSPDEVLTEHDDTPSIDYGGWDKPGDY